jgi:hypothetical protein
MPCWRGRPGGGVCAQSWQRERYSWAGAVEMGWPWLAGCMCVVPRVVRRWAGATRAESSRE